MNFKILNLAAIILAAAIIGGCTSTGAKVAEPVAQLKDPVEEVLQNMTLTEKIGQMMIIGVYGNAVDDDSRFMLTNYHMGGIIFFDRNMDSRAQVRNFAEALNMNADEPVPLFIALDEEGGIVSRMKHDLPPPPSQEEIGYGEPADAFTYAKLTGEELKSIGVNLNFAPVADVGTNDTRSFGSDAKVVAEFVSQAAKGYEAAGIFYCLKHFPGIGKGTLDSHEDVSTVNADRETLDAEDLLPFKKVINEQDNSKFMVMLSHLKYGTFDVENSASLSSAVMQFLRDELKFTGVIITDDLDMGAIVKHFDATTIGVDAVKAGADILLSCHDYATQQAIYLSIYDAVKRGEIPEERINESVRRILKMKLELKGKNN